MPARRRRRVRPATLAGITRGRQGEGRAGPLPAARAAVACVSEPCQPRSGSTSSGPPSDPTHLISAAPRCFNRRCKALPSTSAPSIVPPFSYTFDSPFAEWGVVGSVFAQAMQLAEESLARDHLSIVRACRRRSPCQGVGKARGAPPRRGAVARTGASKSRWETCGGRHGFEPSRAVASACCRCLHSMQKAAEKRMCTRGTSTDARRVCARVPVHRDGAGSNMWIKTASGRIHRVCKSG